MNQQRLVSSEITSKRIDIELHIESVLSIPTRYGSAGRKFR